VKHLFPRTKGGFRFLLQSLAHRDFSPVNR
jgi:hypothetical protein